MIRVQDARKMYQQVTAVDGVSFHVGPGEVVALLGPNGAGKTTLVRMIMSIILPDAGSVSVSVAGRPAARHELGYMPEERGLHKGVPIQRTLKFFGRLQGLGSADAADAARRWLERLELADRAGARIEELSRGNQQKVQFAASVLHAPRIAVLDEPFAGLDPMNQELFIQLLRELARNGTAVLFSAHQMDLVERVADRLVVLRHGRVVLAGTLEELQRRFGAGEVYGIRLGREIDTRALDGHPAVRSVERADGQVLRVGLAPGAAIGAVLEALDVTAVASIQHEEKTLHDMYVEIMRGADRLDADVERTGP